MISVKVIADSKNQFGNRITTMIVTMPRIILAEFNTHRMFSRNSASSRAIPFEKMVKSVKENPFIPIAWQADHKGMQGTEYIHNDTGRGGDESRIQVGWQNAIDNAIREAEWMNMYGLTKQICNRILEPFMWHTVILTATEWENFFALRCPQYVLIEEEGKLARPELTKTTEKIFRSRKDYLKYKEDLQFDSNISNEIQWLQLNKGQAEIHMMALAEAMWDAYNESIPKELKAGEWHIPFGDNIQSVSESVWELCGYKESDPIFADYTSLQLARTFTEIKIKIATARCARVSYTVVGEEGKPDNYENDIKLHNRLIESKHASPFEHIAQSSDNMDRSRNFTGGWKQYREIINL